MKKWNTIFCLIILVSCNNHPTSTVNFSDSSKLVPEDTGNHLQLQTGKVFRGLFVSSPSERSFRSCDNPEMKIMVNDSSHQIDSLYKTMAKQTLTFLNEYMYVEVEGKMSDTPAVKGGKKFDGVLTISKVDTFKKRDYNNNCIPYEFWAIGETPHWSLQISKKEQLIALKDFTAKQVYLFPFFEPSNQNDEVFTYRSENTATSNSLLVVIRKQDCTDEKSGNHFQYSARVMINGRSYKGCALSGNSIPF